MPARPEPRPRSLWSAVHCPTLALAAVWRMARDRQPRAVHETRRGRVRIVQACRMARQAGVVPDQGLETALALAPDLRSRSRSPEMERQALEQIALVAHGHSHQVALAPPDTVLLETAGSRRLRGGLEPLIRDLETELGHVGFRVRCSSAPWPAAARLMARQGRHTDAGQDVAGILDSLPVGALTLEPEQIRALRGCGLETLGGLRVLPGPERARRFGPDLNRRLDEVYGRTPTPLAAWHPPEEFRSSLELPEATADTRALVFALNRALENLEQWLRLRDRALTGLQVRLEREDKGPACDFRLGLSRPGFDREQLLDLARLKLKDLQPGGPVETLRMQAETTTEHRPHQADLWSGNQRGDAWPALLDRLSARLGDAGVRGLVARADHRPEMAWDWAAPGTESPTGCARPRPGWLLPEPRPCRRRDMQLEDGPERIETGWWDGQDCRRDYWIARDRNGRRLWIFREYKPRRGWFIHGLFG